MPAPASKARGGRGSARAKAKEAAAPAPAPTPTTTTSLELPDFLREDDDGADELGAQDGDARAQEARYDASYNALMDELDRDDDDEVNGAGAADESAATTGGSLSVLSTSLLPRRTVDDADDDADEDDFDLFAPRRKAESGAQVEMRDADDPAYAQGLADILGSDDGDDDEQDGLGADVDAELVPSRSALEDLQDAERVDAELSIDKRDTTVETGLASADMEEDHDEDEDDEAFVYTPSPATRVRPANSRGDAEDEDDEDEGFVYRPSAPTPPQLPPLHIDSSTPPPTASKELPATDDVVLTRRSSAYGQPPTISLTAVDPELSFDMGGTTSVNSRGVYSEAAVTPAGSGTPSVGTSASASVTSLPRRRPFASLKVRPKLIARPGSIRSLSGPSSSGAATPLPFPPATSTFGPQPSSSSFEPVGAASYATFPVASSSAAVAERDILRLSSLRKIGGKLYLSQHGDGNGDVMAQQQGALSSAAALAHARGLGAPTVLAAGDDLVAVGTTRGWTLVFALDQELRCVIGTEALAKQAGSVTALAFSLDSTFVGVGFASGHIALFDLTKPSIPARQVAPVSLRSVQAGRKEGHLPGCAIVQLAFVARRHTAIVSADAAGVAVYHALGKILGVSSNDTLRIFGQYPASEPGSKGKDVDRNDGQLLNGNLSTAGSDTASINGVDLTRLPSHPARAPSTKSILFGVQPLPLGSPHLADVYNFVAILTPHKLVLVGLKPTPRTWWRKTAPTRRQADGSRSKMGQWQTAQGLDPDDATPQLPEDEDFADGLEVGDGLVGLNGGSSPLRLVRGIPEGRTADDFVTSRSTSSSTTLANGALDADEEQEIEGEKDALCGAIAWLPASELQGHAAQAQGHTQSNGAITQHVHPILAFSFGRDLLFLHLVKGRRQVRRVLPEASNGRSSRSRRSQANGGSPNTSMDTSITYEDHLGLQEEMALVHKHAITGLQWLSSDLLLILDSEGLSLFDLRVRRCTERQRLVDFRVIAQRWDTEGTFHPVRPAKGSLPPGMIQALTASHSFRVHQGRAFLLGTREVLSGTALSWTDRILNLVASGDFLAAIELTQKYYEGKAPGSVIGLPSDRAEQRRIVGRKLRDLMAASATYAFSPDRLTDNTHVTPDGRGVDRTPLFEGIARVCALACLALDDLGFLFGDLYELYAENGIKGIFVSQMEEFIVSGRMRRLPTDVVQRLVAYRKTTGDYALAERIIYHVDPLCLDLDQAIGLCLEQRLYDALIYVYTEAMDDFVGPLVEFVELIKRVLYGPDHGTHLDGSMDGSVFAPSEDEVDSVRDHHADRTKTAKEQDGSDAYTLFSYLAAGMLGLAYPGRKPYPPERALQAKQALFGFVFAGTCVMWPQGAGGRLVTSVPDEEASEPTYPYLRLLLQFDADALLEVFELAFEDSFLNGDDDDEEEDAEGAERGRHSKSDFTRQKIVDLVLDIAREEALSGYGVDEDEDDDVDHGRQWALRLRTSASIFVARNAPKFPQFIRLTPAQVESIFEALTNSEADPESHEERQLATEYLLSSYKVADGDRLLELLERAGFWRLLQDALRRERRWDRLVEIYIGELRAELDAEEEALGEDVGRRLGDDVDQVVLERPIFAQLEQVLSRAIRERTTWLDELGPRITEATPTLVRADVIRTVALMERFFPGRHHEALEELGGDELAQLAYLRCFYDPAYTRGFAMAATSSSAANINSTRAGVGVGTEQAASAAAQSQHRARTALELLSVGERLEPANRDRYIALLARHRPDDLVQAFDAQPWAAYVDLEKGGRFLFDKHFGAKVLGGAGAGAEVDQDGAPGDGDKEEGAPSTYRQVKPFLDGMTSAYRLRIELLGMANRLFDRDLFGELDRLAARRVRGWRPKAALSGPLATSSSAALCGACGEPLVPSTVTNGMMRPQASLTAVAGSTQDTQPSSSSRRSSSRPSLRDRQRSASMISLPPPRPPSSPFIEAAAGGRAKPDKGKGVSRGYFRPFEDAESASASASMASPLGAAGRANGLLSPDVIGGGGMSLDSGTARARRLPLGPMSPSSHSQLRALSMGNGASSIGGIHGASHAASRVSSTPSLGADAGSATLSPALGLGWSSTASVFAEMQASETQPVEMFARDAAALGMSVEEGEGEEQEGEEEEEEEEGERPDGLQPSRWTSSLRLDARSRARRVHAHSDHGVVASRGGIGAGLGVAEDAEEDDEDEALVVYASGQVCHRRCC